MKIYIITLFAVIATAGTAMGQIRSNNSIGNTIQNQSAFLDASAASFNSSVNNGKGLVFPRTNLTTFTFAAATTSALNFPTAYDGMIVYNTTAGTTPATGSGIGNQAVDVGYYYFSNPAAGPGNYTTAGGQWVRLAQGSLSGNADWYKFEADPAHPLNIAAGNTDSQYVMGSVAIGQSAAPFAKLTVNNGGSTALPVLQLKTPFTGAATDSLLTWNPTDSTVRKIPVSAIVSLVMNNLCTNAVIVNGSAGGSYAITAGGGAATMSITSAGTSPTYQWYSNTTASATGGTAISGATSASYSFSSSTAGTYYFYCVVVASGVAPCSLVPVTSGVFTVNVQQNAANLPVGTGSFTGQTCFDIAQSNDNANGCGTLASRTSQRTDFTIRTVSTTTAPYTGVQVYTFTPSGVVSNVRFQYNDPTGTVIDSIVPGSASYATGTNISTACTVTVYYKSSLETSLVGLTSANALTATLYAVYNNNAAGTGTDMALPLTATLADCACCGAATAAGGGGWLNFMCYNLGADQTLPPFTPAQGLHGAMYQWGFAAPALSAADNIANSGTVSGWPNNGSTASIGTTDASGNWNMATANPCPAGWVVPTNTQWTNVINNNTWTRLGSFANNDWNSGVMVGQSLFLPAAGYRNYTGGGWLYGRGVFGLYWSSTPSSTSTGVYYMYFESSSQYTSTTYRSNGNSVRCVQQ